MAGRNLARRVRVVTRLAAGSEIAPDQPEIGPLGNRLDVVDRVRGVSHTLAQAPPAERVSFQLREAQRPPRRVIPARRGRATPAIGLHAPLRRAAQGRLVDRRTPGHQSGTDGRQTSQGTQCDPRLRGRQNRSRRQLRRTLREFRCRNRRLIRRPRLAPGQRMQRRPPSRCRYRPLNPRRPTRPGSPHDPAHHPSHRQGLVRDRGEVNQRQVHQFEHVRRGN